MVQAEGLGSGVARLGESAVLLHQSSSSKWSHHGRHEGHDRAADTDRKRPIDQQHHESLPLSLARYCLLLSEH